MCRVEGCEFGCIGFTACLERGPLVHSEVELRHLPVEIEQRERGAKLHTTMGGAGHQVDR